MVAQKGAVRPDNQHQRSRVLSRQTGRKIDEARKTRDCIGFCSAGSDEEDLEISDAGLGTVTCWPWSDN